MDRICRLCLKKCDHTFQDTEENATEISYILQVINLTISEEAKICTKCWESFKKCSNFKSTCLNVEDFLVQCVNKTSNGKVDLKYIYLSKEANGNDIPKNHNICRLCMCSFKVWSFMTLDNEKGDVLLQKMMLKCLPELDLHATENPVICVPCHGSLQHYFNFITYCSIVEENIKKYCEAAGIGGTGQIKLKDVLEFTATKIINKIDKTQMERKSCENEEYEGEQKRNEELLYISTKNVVSDGEISDEVNAFRKEETLFEETEFKIELKPENLNEMDNGQFDDESKSTIKCEEGDDQVDANEEKHSYCQERVDELKIEICEEMLDQKFTPCYHEVEVKTEKQNIDSIQDSGILPQEDTNNYNLPKMQKHINKAGSRTSFKSSALEKVYQCASCPFQSKYKSSLVIHMDHKDSPEMYQCKHCSFQIKCKRQLKKHMLTHRDPSEPTTYRCDFCSYKVKHKRYLVQHLLTHSNPSAVRLHKCPTCPFQTKHKQSLYPHMLTHKDPSEITMHRCNVCSFSTKLKNSLTQHLLTHKDPSEIEMYHCASCSFQTKIKHYLIRHFLVHKTPAEIKMHRCDLCSYQTKEKSNLNSHMLTHKDPSEVTMYLCEFCSFQTKHKRGMVRHIWRRHKKAKQPSDRTTQ